MTYKSKIIEKSLNYFKRNPLIEQMFVLVVFFRFAFFHFGRCKFDFVLDRWHCTRHLVFVIRFHFKLSEYIYWYLLLNWYNMHFCVFLVSFTITTVCQWYGTNPWGPYLYWFICCLILNCDYFQIINYFVIFVVFFPK